MKYLLLLTCISLQFSMCAQHYNGKIALHPDEILLAHEKRAAICLVGSFHFSYPGQDAHKTAESDQVNVFLPKRQKEMNDLIDYILAFKPTKIAVEAGRNTGYLMHQYRDIQSGAAQRGSSEIHQIAFRLLDRLSLDTLYGIDASTLVYSLSNGKQKKCMKSYIKKLFKNWDFQSDEPWSKKYNEWYDHHDQLALDHSLLDYFKWMNWSENIKRGKGAYFLGDFKNNGHDGADATALHWYSRNFRIARNIQQITESNEDRILVLIGAGHLGILDDIFGSTPEYELVDFNAISKD